MSDESTAHMVMSRIADQALEFSPDGVVVVADGGQIVYANRAMHALVGADEPLLGRSIDEFVPDAVRHRHHRLRSDFEDAPEQRPMGRGADLALKRADGSEVPVEISLSPFDLDGLHVTAAIRDLTDRRTRERELAAANDRLALVAERERIGRDLHDVVLQRLYATGLTVQAVGSLADDETSSRLDGVIDEIDRTISEIRTIVFALGSAGHKAALRQELADVVAQSNRVLGFTPTLRIDGPIESVLAEATQFEMIASLREAIGNVARHASATCVDLSVVVEGHQVVLTVSDNGVGLPDPTSRPALGNGLVNLRARAAQLGGTCELRPGPRRGAVLTWTAPF